MNLVGGHCQVGSLTGAVASKRVTEAFKGSLSMDGNAFFYCQKEVFSSKQKLYEFEALCVGTMLFRCSKSMILNAGKIDYVLPSLSGRFEAVLDNGEKVIISRQYVSTLKRLLGR